MKRKNNNQSRAAGKTQISIALPQELVDRIDAQAALENRNRSNFIVTSMEQVMDKVAPTAPKPVKANADKSHKAAVAKTVVKKTAAASSKGNASPLKLEERLRQSVNGIAVARRKSKRFWLN